MSASQGECFVKVNSANRFPGMFEAESKGLNRLRQTDTLRIPEVYSVCQFGDDAYLLMEYLPEAPKGTDFWEVFGTGLASLHRHSNESYGLDHDNYIGSLPQSNTVASDWTSFFVEQRLEPQLRMADSLINSSERRRFEQLFHRLDQLIPSEPPALLHGDLWSGNYLTDDHGMPVLMDPAIYFGHREMDLAMMHLFGGFSTELFQHYHDVYPLEKGWRERIDLHNLYPLLVHVNLFGPSYLSGIRSTLVRYV